jgi:PST family polysaccharide transporter
MDTEALSTGAQRSFTLLFKVVLPIGVLTAALASHIVVVMYGSEWSPAASALRYLAVLTVVRVLISLALDVLMGTGATRSMLWINATWAIALIPALIVGVEWDGIRGAGLAHAVVGLGVATPLTVLALRRLGIRLSPILPALLRPTAAAGAAGLIVWAIARVIDTAPIVELLVAGVVGLATYAVTAVPFTDVREWSRQARDRIRAVRDPGTSALGQGGASAM